nr:metal ABC transporter permease [Deinobacterium chartae]
MLVSSAAALLGVFLVLRRMSLMSDAISHAVLPGIVAAYWLTGGEAATVPALLGAGAMGLLTVSAVELLARSGRVRSDAAIGVVFPLFFSVGVILVSMYFRDVHLDLDAVLYGEIAYAPFNTLTLLGHELPESVVLMGSLALLNALFVALFYKELKLATFDAGLAAALGFAPGLIHYLLMTLLSFTTVGAFQSVGAILVIAFVIVPPATAYLLTRRLPVMIGLSLLFGALSSVAGYVLAILLDASIAGMMATLLGVFFFAALLFSPLEGILATRRRRARQRRQVAARLLVAHLAQAGGAGQLEETARQLGWTLPEARTALETARQGGWARLEAGRVDLTPRGLEAARQGPKLAV